MAFPKRILYPAMGIYGVGTLGVYTYIRSNQPDVRLWPIYRLCILKLCSHIRVKSNVLS